MKRKITALILILVMIASWAYAREILDEEYTDVPSVMTQDAVVSIEVNQPELGCTINVLEPDEKSMELLEKIYDFVWREKNRPVRYYDEETQAKIQALVPEIDIDILHMTEFMRQEMFGQPEESVFVQRQLDVDYQPGQLVVVVLGYEEENGEYRWFPYRAEVPTIGMITYTIPVEDYELLVGQQVIYHVLTIRVGDRGGVLSRYEIVEEPVAVPSKDAGDIVQVRRWYSESGEAIDDTFRIFFVDKTNLMLVETQRIGEFIMEENPAIDWFPEEIQNQAQLLVGDEADVHDMLIYDIMAVMAEDYRDTYGDVATENVFASAYLPEYRMFAILGFPIEDAEERPYFEWYCLRAESIDEIVELVYKQLVIPQMEIEPAMMIIFSEPLEPVEAEE